MAWYTRRTSFHVDALTTRVAQFTAKLLGTTEQHSFKTTRHRYVRIHAFLVGEDRRHSVRAGSEWTHLLQVGECPGRRVVNWCAHGWASVASASDELVDI